MAPENSGARSTIANDGFRFGDRVVVTAGLAAGLTGKVVERAKVLFGDIPVWAVEFPLPLGLRSIREDFLRRVA